MTSLSSSPHSLHFIWINKKFIMLKNELWHSSGDMCVHVSLCDWRKVSERHSISNVSVRQNEARKKIACVCWAIIIVSCGVRCTHDAEPAQSNRSQASSPLTKKSIFKFRHHPLDIDAITDVRFHVPLRHIWIIIRSRAQQGKYLKKKIA